MAILPANILIADSHARWMRLAAALVLEQDLGATFAQDESGVYASNATDALRLTIEDRPGGMALHLDLRDVASQRSDRVLDLRTANANLISALDKLATQIDSHASTFGTRNVDALAAFSDAFFTQDRERKLQRFQDAIAADPSFGLAYSALASADPAQAQTVLQDGLSHRNSFSPLDRVRFDFVRARLLQMPISQQAVAGVALASAAPNDADVLASVAPILFLAGKADDGVRLIDRAIASNPANPAFREVLATGLIENRQFAQAEKVLSSLSSNPAVLPALAISIFFQGDKARATTTYDRFLTSVNNAAAKALLKGSWMALTGNRTQAITFLQNAHFDNPPLLAFAKTQIVVWQLLDHQREAARNTAAGGGPIAELLAQGANSADEWRSKIDALPANVASPMVKTALLRYGYFLNGFYPQAVEAWREANAASGETDLRARVMLAASLNAAGQAEAAKRIRVQPFLPDLSDFLSAISFSQLLRYAG